MGTIASVAQRFAEIDLRLGADLQALIQEQSPLVADLVREQLDAGMDGDGRPLTPSYLDDPYFREVGYAHPEVAARNYMQWKQRITPPATTWRLMLPPRDPSTPNLRINGYYHSTIAAVPIAGGVRVTSTGDALGIGSAVTAKYGDERLYTLGKEARRFMIENVITPHLRRLFGKA